MYASWYNVECGFSAKENFMAQHGYPLMDVEDYLVLDQNSKHARYEYLDGELTMLAGGSANHSIIAINLAIAVKQALREKKSPCQVYSSDIRLQLSESRYVYADISVSCDPRDLDDMMRHPRLVVEVLSPGTEANDRGKKAIYYRECASLMEYVLVDSRSVFIEVQSREKDGWQLRSYETGSTVYLKSLDIRFPIDDIYEGLKLTGKRE